MSRGALQKLQRLSRYENEFVPDQKKGPKIDPHFFFLEGFRSTLHSLINLGPAQTLVFGWPQTYIAFAASFMVQIQSRLGG